MSELHRHFVKINSTDFAEAPIVFYGITIVEITICIGIIIGQPFVCLAFLRAEVIHRNFRFQMCFACTYYVIQIYTRFILLYYELNDITPTKEDNLLFWVETIRDTILGYFCAIPGSFAIERFIATKYWSWYEKGSYSTLWVLAVIELTNIVPAFTNAWLCYTERISNTANYLMIGVILVISLIVFIITYMINLRMRKKISRGASINFYSVARAFQVRENVEVMTFMFKFSLPAAATSSISFAGIGWKLYGPTEWRLSRNIAYACFDLGLVFFALSFFYSAVLSNERIHQQFRKIRPIATLYRLAGLRVDRRRKHVIKLSVPAETAHYFSQLRNVWERRLGVLD